MGLDGGPASDTGLSLSIPPAGVHEVLRGWSGEGSIFESLAYVSSPDALDWTTSDIQRRARRVLLGIVEPLTATWPRTARAWEEYLPSSTVAERRVSLIPAGSVNWLETRRAGGWPPREFTLRTRRRVMDETPIATLAWLSRHLRVVLDDVRPSAPVTAELLEARLLEVETALAPWEDIEAVRPDRLSLLSLRTSGYPWTSVAAAADLAVRAERDAEYIAFDLIAPDPDLGWRLFHLAVYGMVLRALRNHRFVVTWRRPLAGTRPGAQVEAIAPSGTRFDLWFEAGAARSSYGLEKAAYHDAVGAIEGVGGAIGVDVMLIAPGARALLLECKWSTNPRYVGRYGFHQASSYALDALAGLADEVWSFVVGPQEIVPETSAATSLFEPMGLVLGSTAPGMIGDVVAAFLARDPTVLQ